MTTDATEPLTYDSDRLIRQWRERYTARRTIAHQMLNDAEVLVRDAISRELEQQRRESKTQREYELERRERQVEHAEGAQQWQIDRLQRQLAEAKEKIASLSPRVTQMREERETVEDGTVVRLMAPTVPSYGDNTAPRPWMLGELEDVIYRLRLSGGGEDTEVRFKRDAIEACVPFPEFALTPPAREAVAVPDSVPPSRLRRVGLMAGLGLLLVVLALLGLVLL